MKKIKENPIKLEADNFEEDGIIFCRRIYEFKATDGRTISISITKAEDIEIDEIIDKDYAKGLTYAIFIYRLMKAVITYKNISKIEEDLLDRIKEMAGGVDIDNLIKLEKTIIDKKNKGEFGAPEELDKLLESIRKLKYIAIKRDEIESFSQKIIDLIKKDDKNKSSVMVYKALLALAIYNILCKEDKGRGWQ